MPTFVTAGEVVAVRAEPRWVAGLIADAVGIPPGATPVTGAEMAAGRAGAADPATGDDTATVRLVVERGDAAFDRTGLRPVTRGADSDGTRTVLRDVGGSGFDMLVVAGDQLEVTARYRPRPAVRLANRLLARRFGLLAGQVLVHYPVLWRAGWRGRVPLHACVARTGSGTVLLAGPGGVGKSTLLLRLLADGATATADNLCCADETHCYGVAEPLRVDAGVGQRAATSHGRATRLLADRAARLAPDRLVVLERGVDTEIAPADPDSAARALVAGTYAAGELRRYWAFAATLALATGRGPAHPPIAAVAASYAARLPCLRVRAGDGAAVGLTDLYGTPTTGRTDGWPPAQRRGPR